MDKPLRADARRNRDALVAAARQIYAEGGAEVPLEDFAHRAGVGVGTLYRHFPGREALALAVFEGEIAALRARAAELSASQAPDQALMTLMGEMVDLMYAQPGLVQSLNVLLEPDPAAHEGVTQPLVEEVASLLARGVEHGVFRRDIQFSALLLVLHGLGAGAQHGSPQQAAHDVVRLVLDGFRATAETLRPNPPGAWPSA